ncbi:hypothetical protein IAT38_004508 [Cryptococcus sp. DSM 104549]
MLQIDQPRHRRLLIGVLLLVPLTAATLFYISDFPFRDIDDLLPSISDIGRLSSPDASLQQSATPNGGKWALELAGSTGKPKGWGGLPGWLGLGGGRDREAEAREVLRLRDTFAARYPVSDWDTTGGRARNVPALERLATCISNNTCGPREETAVILASGHFDGALRGRTSGEDIWAMSIIEALTALNYTLLYGLDTMDTLTLYQGIPTRVPVIMWEGSGYRACVGRNESNWEASEQPRSPGTWQFDEGDGRVGCVKRVGFEEGVPPHKSFSFHFWREPSNLLGRQFTLSPEDFAMWNGGVGNHYIGYSIETRCRAVPLPEERKHRGIILGKKKEYFDPDYIGHMWKGVLPGAIDAMPSEHNETSGEDVEFELIATGGRKIEEGETPDVLYESKIHNLGPKPQKEWYQTVASSKFMLGLGRPWLSPSPYDALCFGVPFINPIIEWDSNDPSDWTKWNTQHQALRTIPPPFVYHVQAGNEEQLAGAFKAALENPIKPYIPPAMRKSSVMERVRGLVETDWKPWAEAAVEELYTDRGLEFNYLI